jgi:hypothetical protein
MAKPFCAPTDIATVTLDHMVDVSVQSPKIPVAESIAWGPVILLSRVPPEGATVTLPRNQNILCFFAENTMEQKRRHIPHLVSPTWTSQQVTQSCNHGLLLFLTTHMYQSPDWNVSNTAFPQVT